MSRLLVQALSRSARARRILVAVVGLTISTVVVLVAGTNAASDWVRNRSQLFADLSHADHTRREMAKVEIINYLASQETRAEVISDVLRELRKDVEPRAEARRCLGGKDSRYSVQVARGILSSDSHSYKALAEILGSGQITNAIPYLISNVAVFDSFAGTIENGVNAFPCLTALMDLPWKDAELVDGIAECDDYVTRSQLVSLLISRLGRDKSAEVLGKRLAQMGDVSMREESSESERENLRSAMELIEKQRS